MSAAMTRSTPLAEAASQYWLEQIALVREKMAGLLAEGRLDEPVSGGNPDQAGRIADEIHDLRVAVRRCQSTAKALAVYLPDPWPRKIQKTLQPLRLACDRIRDLDVLLAWLKVQPSAGLATAGLFAALHDKHDRAYESLLETLSSKTSLKAPGKVEKLLQPADSQAGNASKPAICRASCPSYLVKDVVAPVLLARAARMTVYFDLLASPPDDETFECALHKLRIAGKDFRYTLEMFMPALCPEGTALREQFRQLQDQVGEFHDDIKFAGLLEELKTQASLPGELIADLLHELTGLKKEQWPKIRGNLRLMTPKWFAGAVAQIMAEGD
jgi:CHAD domain-containing protein